MRFETKKWYTVLIVKKIRIIQKTIENNVKIRSLTMSKRNIIDDGYAVWLIEQNKGVSFLDIHINEWFSYKEQTYLDMGLRVYNANNVNGICLFFPFCIAKNEIIDLFNLISVPEIASDIFNTICAVSQLKV